MYRSASSIHPSVSLINLRTVPIDVTCHLNTTLWEEKGGDGLETKLSTIQHDVQLHNNHCPTFHHLQYCGDLGRMLEWWDLHFQKLTELLHSLFHVSPSLVHRHFPLPQHSSVWMLIQCFRIQLQSFIITRRKSSKVKKNHPTLVQCSISLW